MYVLGIFVELLLVLNEVIVFSAISDLSKQSYSIPNIYITSFLLLFLHRFVSVHFVRGVCLCVCVCACVCVCVRVCDWLACLRLWV